MLQTRLDELIQAKSAAEKQLAEGPVTARRRISRVGSDLDMNIALVKEEMEIRKAEAEKEQAKIDAFRLVWAIGNQQCGEWRNIDKYGNRLGAAAEIEPIAGVRKLSITKLEASDEANTRERRFLASLQGVGSSIRAQKLLRRLQRRRERAAEGGESRDLALEEEGESTSIATLLAKLRIPTGGDPFSSVTRTQSRRQSERMPWHARLSCISALPCPPPRVPLFPGPFALIHALGSFLPLLPSNVIPLPACLPASHPCPPSLTLLLGFPVSKVVYDSTS